MASQLCDISCLSSNTDSSHVLPKGLLDLCRNNWTHVQCIECKTGQTFKIHGYLYCEDCRRDLTKNAPQYKCKMCNKNDLEIIDPNGKADEICRSCANKSAILQSIDESISAEKIQNPHVEYRFDFHGVAKRFPIIYPLLCTKCKYGHGMKFAISNKNICYPTIICKTCQFNVSQSPGHDCVNCKVSKVFVNECGIVKQNICKNCKKKQDQYIAELSS